MTPEASKSMWSRTRRSLLSRSYPNFSMVAAIVVAVVLFLGVSGIESKNAPARIANAQVDQGICDRTLEVQLAIIDWLGDKACENFTDADLLSLTDFSVEDYPTLISLKSGDFAGMTNILKLRFQRNSLEELTRGHLRRSRRGDGPPNRQKQPDRFTRRYLRRVSEPCDSHRGRQLFQQHRFGLVRRVLRRWHFNPFRVRWQRHFRDRCRHVRRLHGSRHEFLPQLQQTSDVARRSV